MSVRNKDNADKKSKYKIQFKKLAKNSNELYLTKENLKFEIQGISINLRSHIFLDRDGVEVTKQNITTHTCNDTNNY